MATVSPYSSSAGADLMAAPQPPHVESGGDTTTGKSTLPYCKSVVFSIPKVSAIPFQAKSRSLQVLPSSRIKEAWLLLRMFSGCNSSEHHASFNSSLVGTPSGDAGKTGTLTITLEDALTLVVVPSKVEPSCEKLSRSILCERTARRSVGSALGSSENISTPPS